ncbi:hypothetical protein Y032_0046g1343 [Ancylostoma ceylanicum]|uniref:Uncharacterized protein n=1 Tax=Ancylostoma ceylanicum TaxID=53326 RepID=A0A016UDI1_9BILA|nr:hypothetical protein Y032_0046g1343 [Ancylostoma ceylanicum]
MDNSVFKYSQLQMSVDKSRGRGAGLSLSAARIQRGMQGRGAEENRAAVTTLVYGLLELTIISSWLSSGGVVFFCMQE